MNKTLALRCYCCGDNIEGTAVLAGYNKEGGVDRAFIFNVDHAENIGEDLSTLVVRFANKK